jgi:acetylornithine aminotransferase/acetylornithine/N-succinyldiaminopimelate aminotransferase
MKENPKKMQGTDVEGLYQKYVVPSYGRFDLALSHGSGSWVYDFSGKRYLDLGAGIAVCGLGHSNPEITKALVEQSQRLVHVSNVYYNEPQARLAEALVNQIAPGKMFFSNSGAEANEGLIKLARKFGHDEGRFEIITALNSFHGRTMAGISATGQDKVKKGFEPMVQGFRHVPYNDLKAMRDAISPATVAILIEGVQGEGGVTPARPEYLLGLRQLCDEKKLLLFMDEVQCGYFRSGRFVSYQRILEGVSGGDKFLPDGISMAKAIAGGLPMGAFWAREPYGDLLGPGTHATTFGGTPLVCAVALKVLEVSQRDKLGENVRQIGAYLQGELTRIMKQYPAIIKGVRGLGLMLGFELAQNIPAFSQSQKSHSIQFVHRMQEAGVLTIPAGNQVIRLLPPLNLSRAEAEQGVKAIESVVKQLAG